LTALLESLGLAVESFGSAREFLVNPLTRAKGCVVLDVNMPGMTGPEVIRGLRQEPGLERLPILILSGEPVSRSELTDLQADGAVLKPFDVLALVEQIRGHISRDDRNSDRELRA